MTMTATVPKTIEYRVVLVHSVAGGMLVLGAEDPPRLPRVRIPEATRPAQQLQKAIVTLWGIWVHILDIRTDSGGSSARAVAQVLGSRAASEWKEITPDQLMDSELSQDERLRFEALLQGSGESRFSQIEWMDEVIPWIESVTGRTFSSKRGIEQWNAGAGFALYRFCSDDGRHYWLKGTSAPNAHEFSITCYLARVCPSFVPTLVASRNEWNVWLTEDAGHSLSDSPEVEVLVDCTVSLAALQITTIDSIDALLIAGAFDLRLAMLRIHIDEVTDYLIDAMARQTSTKVAPLSRNRLLALSNILRDACDCLETLGIPNTLLHNDLNPGNVLHDGRRCVFIDWSEAAVGNPFLTFARLSLLGPQNEAVLRDVYRRCWAERLSESSIDDAFVIAPLLAIFAYLSGRGDWLKNSRNIQPGFEGYARSLARHMDRAAQNPQLLGILCR
jgi:Phosphotransferase enzyme family